MKKLLLLIAFTFSAFHSFATHIVGGEFELNHISGYSYQLALNLYFDAANGDPGANDPTIRVSIFEKASDRQVGLEILLPRTTESFVHYTNIDCAIGSLITKKILYSVTILLSPEVYTHPQGYYVVWERCCRNNVISNIRNPADAGMSFYMEFPPVVMNNTNFINSSPKLFPPLSDYACQNSLFYYDFSGTDSDGDSLVYSMSTPLQGHTYPPYNVAPPALPAPYLPVTWTSGLGVDNQIPGNPPMQIDRHTGLLTVAPTELGLFVFGVKCEELRNGIKIGEVRRDFQLLVVDCPVNAKPAVNLKTAASGFYNENNILTITETGDRCLDIFLSDLEPDQQLKVTARPLNFSTTLPLLAVPGGVVNQGGATDSLKTTVCFPDCFDTKGKVFRMDLIVEDSGCSLPKKDTLHLSFIVEPVPNLPPEITTTSPTPVLEAGQGDTINFSVIGTDADNDLIKLTAKGQNFDLAAQGIQFEEASGQGRVVSEFQWVLDCRAVGSESYKIDFTATTLLCGDIVEKTTTIEIRPQYNNSPPELVMEPGTTAYNLLLNAPMKIDLFGTDADDHSITIQAEGVGFELADFGMTFPTMTANGNVQSVFNWTPDCRARSREEFEIMFTLTEATCSPSPARTLTLNLRVPQPEVVEFKPANIFTPNADNLNDFFEMPDLPADYCEATFSDIQVFSRWGSLVYESRNRDFRWDGSNHSEGVYYYLINFTHRQYKGTVTLMR